MHEDYRNKTINFSGKASNVVCYNTLVPEFCKYHDLEIWNAVENFENEYADSFFKNKKARERFKRSTQTAQMLVVALPHEFNMLTNQKLVENFIRTCFLPRNLFVTYAIHNNPGNIHAHIQISRRAIADNGDFANHKDRTICTKIALLKIRKLWADLVNSMLQIKGMSMRITEKSFEDLGINRKASRHIGWYMNQKRINQGYKITNSKSDIAVAV